MATAVGNLRAQYKQSFEWLEGTMAGLDEETVHYKPAGMVSPIAGQVAHAVGGVDMLILGLVAGQTPLIMGAFAGKSGISEPPPSGDWAEWANRVTVNLPELHEYSKAVFDAVDEYIGSLSDDDLDEEKEADFGAYSVAWWLNTMLLNTYSHTGEIAAVKGLQGLKGYPM